MCVFEVVIWVLCVWCASNRIKLEETSMNRNDMTSHMCVWKYMEGERCSVLVLLFISHYKSKNQGHFLWWGWGVWERLGRECTQLPPEHSIINYLGLATTNTGALLWWDWGGGRGGGRESTKLLLDQANINYLGLATTSTFRSVQRDYPVAVNLNAS